MTASIEFLVGSRASAAGSTPAADRRAAAAWPDSVSGYRIAALARAARMENRPQP